MTEAEFKKEIMEKRDEYMNNITAYLDALVECDFDKVVDLCNKTVTIFSTESMAFLAKRCNECDKIDDLEDSYMEYVKDVRNKALGD